MYYKYILGKNPKNAQKFGENEKENFFKCECFVGCLCHEFD